ncbi:GPI ethanolamine phosphate transferase 1 isoform X2 [Drosophila navojoa]|nr:GPI ethanolamine phosphate transferase 1 isoform X2 [Drosophila navojoa]
MAARANALQLLAQYVRLQKQHMRGLFAPVLNSFHELTSERIAEYVGYISTSFKLNQFDESLANSAVVMQLALEGIDYYQGYYCNVMLLSTTATILGWMFYLYRLLTQDAEPQKMDSHKNDHTSKITVCLWIAVALLIGFVVVQRVPLAVSFYLLLPLPVWIFALRQVPSSNEDLINLPAYNQPAVATPTKASIMQLLLLIGCAELLVFTFFERRLISLCFVAFALYSNWDTFKTKRSFYLWLLLVAALACFPLVPPSVGYQNCSLLLAGILLLLFRQFLSRVQDNFKWHGRWCNTAILINTAVCVHLRNQQTAAPLPLNILSWLYLAYAFASILLSKETALEVRLQHICYNLGTLYTMMCTSYESLFVQLLAIELTTSLAEQRAQVEPLQHQQKSLQSSLRIAFTLILYTFFSLFGSGNIASISSFDPNISRCFLSHFAPFVIMSLVLLKLLLPIVTNISIVYTYSEYARLHERQIFICLLLICDVMGLNFLFLVRNTGSWMEIGSSISHFVIMEVTTLVLVLLAYVSKLLLQLTCSDRVLSKRN